MEKKKKKIHNNKINKYSRLVTVPPGPHVLSDILFSSPIINENNANPNAPSFGGSSAFEYGVDPNVDPELALVFFLFFFIFFLFIYLFFLISPPNFRL